MIQHLTIHIKDHQGKLHPIAGDNAQLITTDAEPARSDLIRTAIRKVEAQPVIEIERGKGTYQWQGDYAELVAA